MNRSTTETIKKLNNFFGRFYSQFKLMTLVMVFENSKKLYVSKSTRLFTILYKRTKSNLIRRIYNLSILSIFSLSSYGRFPIPLSFLVKFLCTPSTQLIRHIKCGDHTEHFNFRWLTDVRVNNNNCSALIAIRNNFLDCIPTEDGDGKFICIFFKFFKSTVE